MKLTHIESTDQLRQHLAAHDSITDCVLQGLDLRFLDTLLRAANVDGAVLLGCKLSSDLVLTLIARGASVFPDLGRDRPYHPTRSQLYTMPELMAGFDAQEPGSFSATLDMAIYQHFQRFRRDPQPPILETLAQRIHDHAIDDALSELLASEGGRKVVGVMGGHALRRDQASYREVARVGWQLASLGYFVATGGGPGAMEAANLGAWMSNYSESELEQAIQLLSGAPDYRSHEYLLLGYQVCDRFPKGAESLAIPTWFYGHEPSNQFATQVAKYFSNSLREDGLLAIAKHGVVYTPGSAGTIQEVFMDAAQNHYGTFEQVSPMVFLGDQEWTTERPVLPLLKTLAQGRQYEHMLGLCPDASSVVRFIQQHPPRSYEKA